jgi:hypothetical protein
VHLCVPVNTAECSSPQDTPTTFFLMLSLLGMLQQFSLPKPNRPDSPLPTLYNPPDSARKFEVSLTIARAQLKRRVVSSTL